MKGKEICVVLIVVFFSSCTLTHFNVNETKAELTLAAISNRNSNWGLEKENVIATSKTVVKNANDFHILASMAPLSVQTDDGLLNVQLPEPHLPTLNESAAAVVKGVDSVATTLLVASSVWEELGSLPVRERAPVVVAGETSSKSELDRNSEPIVSNFRETSEPLAATPVPEEIQNLESIGRSAVSDSRSATDPRSAIAPSVRNDDVTLVTVPIDDSGRSSVVMDGRGWIFISAPAGVSFYSKQREGAAERFAFSVQEPGEYDLGFHRQNLVNGEIEVQNVAVRFVSPAQFPPGDELSNEMSVINKENATDDAHSLIAVSASEMEEAAIVLEANGDIANAIKILEDIRRDFPAYRHMDRARYTLARLYEMPGEQRNIRSALSIYRDILNVHPFSGHIKNIKERIHYIQRTYYKVF